MAIVIVAAIAGAAMCAFVFSAAILSGRISREEEKAEAERWEALKVKIKPDGVHELDPHLYHQTEKHRNVTVEVLEDDEGNSSVGWYRQENTEDEL